MLKASGEKAQRMSAQRRLQACASLCASYQSQECLAGDKAELKKSNQWLGLTTGPMYT